MSLAALLLVALTATVPLDDETEPLYGLSDHCWLLRASGPFNGACCGGFIGFFAGGAASVPVVMFFLDQQSPLAGEGEGVGYALPCLLFPALGAVVGGTVGGSIVYLVEEGKKERARRTDAAGQTMAW